MTAPTFTPWRRIGHRTIAADRGGRLVTICEVFSGPGPLEEADANEALIAAAPELYEAASEVFSLFDCGLISIGIKLGVDSHNTAAVLEMVRILGRVLTTIDGRARA